MYIYIYIERERDVIIYIYVSLGPRPSGDCSDALQARLSRAPQGSERGAMGSKNPSAY